MINTTAHYLTTCGMMINPHKSFTITIKAAPHLKKTAVDATTTFTCAEQQLPGLKRTSEWRYLGVQYTAEGRTKCTPAKILEPLLDTITKAPLKPQQRVYALRTMIVPRLYHQLALGAVNIGALNKVDRILRTILRKWLALPHDIPTAYFHAPIRSGGLGVPSLRWLAPLQRRGRLIAAQRTFQRQNTENFAEEEIAKCNKRLTDHGILYNTTELINRRWAKKLYDSVDGGDLRESEKTPHQHQWISDGTRLLSGKDYINCNRLRISAIPTKSRSSRGRIQDRRCRAGCMAQETINHILQQCHRTHAGRIRRHDAILNYLQRGIEKGGYIVREPCYNTSSGKRKPDIVAVLGQTAVVIDAQVVGEQADLSAAHRRKIRYYEENEVAEAIRKEHKVRNIITTSATLTWKGIWSHESAARLKELGFITTSDLKIISTRVLVGGIAEYRIFGATTTVGWRTGVG